MSFQLPTSTVKVSFAVTCPETAPGEHIRVVGSSDALGAWQPCCSIVELKTSPSTFPAWSSDWYALPNVPFEYKYVICKENGKDGRWEEKVGNRELVIEPKVAMSSQISVFEVFNGPRAGIETEPVEKEVETSDDLFDEETPVMPSLNKTRICANRFGSAPPQLPSVGKSASCSGFKTWDFSCSDFGILRRWATMNCLADLPAGIRPTRRALGLDEQQDQDMVREADWEAIYGGRPAETYRESTSSASASTTTGTANGGGTENRARVGSISASDGISDESTGSPQYAAVEPDKTSEDSESDFGADKCFEDIYSLRRKLGEGAFGVVYACVDRDGDREYAVKVVQRSRLSKYALEHLVGDPKKGKEGEISLHLSLPAHPNIVCLHNCFEESWGFRLVLDLCRGGDLFDEVLRCKQEKASRGVLGALNGLAAKNVMRQVFQALEYCHSQGVVHRDVKVENMLIQDSTSLVPLDVENSQALIKLCDFGLAGRCFGPEPCLEEPVGSPDYLAPEVARLEKYGNKVDIWSAGASLFVCLRGGMPFPAKTDAEALALVREGRYKFDSAWDNIDQGGRDCVASILVQDVSARPSAREALALPWLQ